MVLPCHSFFFGRCYTHLPASKANPRILRPRQTKCLPGHRFSKRFLPEAVHKALVARVALAGLLAPVHKELALVIKAIATFHTHTPGMLLLLCLARCTIFNLGVVEPQCQCRIRRRRRRRCHFVFVFVSMGSPAYQYILEKSISIFIITHFPVSHSFPVTWSAAPEKKWTYPAIVYCIRYLWLTCWPSSGRAARRARSPMPRAPPGRATQ